MKKLLAVGLLCLGTSGALAQWQVPNHNVPLGRGSGIIGFGSTTPGPSGNCLMSNGPSVDPTFQACPGGGSGTTPVPAFKFFLRAQVSQQWTWPTSPSNLLEVIALVNGSGAPGNSSAFTTFGGAGGGGGFALCKIPRPASGISYIRIDPGMSAFPAGSPGTGSEANGATWIRDSNGSTGTQCMCSSATTGQPATNEYLGGDGGIGGSCTVDALYLLRYVPGGMGGASAPTGMTQNPSLPLGTRVNQSFPRGGNSAYGSFGGLNGQMAPDLGGGGAPGTNSTAAQVPAASRATAVTIASGGTGYAVGDVLVLAGGSRLKPVELEVQTVGAGGAITSVNIIQSGSILDVGRPANPLSIESAGPFGTGTGAQINVTTWTSAKNGDGVPGGRGGVLLLWN